MTGRRVTVLWLTPDKPDNISVGRKRIADHLSSYGFAVELRGTTPRTFLNSLREALSGQYDVVIGTTRAGAIGGAAMKIVGRTPFIVDHVDPIRQFAENNPRWLSLLVEVFENVAFIVSDHVLYVYDEEQFRIQQFASSSSHTNLGVDYERFATPSGESKEYANQLLKGLLLQENVAVYIGGLEPIYHVDELLGCAKHLEDWSLLFLGAGSQEERVRQAAASQDNILFLGTVPHDSIPGFLHFADVGISLVDDPHTLKVIEYGAAGLGVVQLAGRAERRFGERVSYCEADPDSIANAIRRAQQDRADLQSFVKRFDWADISHDYEKAIHIATTRE